MALASARVPERYAPLASHTRQSRKLLPWVLGSNSHLARRFRVLPVPQLQHHQVPDHLSEIADVPAAMHFLQLIDKAAAQVATLTRRLVRENIFHHGIHLAI